MDNIPSLLQNTILKKPKNIFISELNWKTLLLKVIVNKPVLIKGHSRSGKSVLALSLKEIFPDRPFFIIPLGSSQDPRLTIIGNTHAKDANTIFDESEFVKAIQTPNAIILLEELSRSHRQVENLLMPVLDPKFKFLKLEDKFNSPKINVAENVSFIATSNEGLEYLGTNILDFAFENRFTVLNMDILTMEEEIELQKINFPNINISIIKQISDIAHLTRLEYLKPDSAITKFISTGKVIEFLELIKYEYSFEEACKIEIYSMYKNDELIFIKSLTNKYIL